MHTGSKQRSDKKLERVIEYVILAAGVRSGLGAEVMKMAWDMSWKAEEPSCGGKVPFRGFLMRTIRAGG